MTEDGKMMGKMIPVSVLTFLAGFLPHCLYFISVSEGKDWNISGAVLAGTAFLFSCFVYGRIQRTDDEYEELMLVDVAPFLVMAAVSGLYMTRNPYGMVSHTCTVVFGACLSKMDRSCGKFSLWMLLLMNFLQFMMMSGRILSEAAAGGEGVIRYLICIKGIEKLLVFGVILLFLFVACAFRAFTVGDLMIYYGCFMSMSAACRLDFLLVKGFMIQVGISMVLYLVVLPVRKMIRGQKISARERYPYTTYIYVGYLVGSMFL